MKYEEVDNKKELENQCLLMLVEQGLVERSEIDGLLVYKHNDNLVATQNVGGSHIVYTKYGKSILIRVFTEQGR